MIHVHGQSVQSVARETMSRRSQNARAHMCDKIRNAHDGRMLDLAFLAYVLVRYIREDSVYKIKFLCHLVLADLKYDVSHYNVFYTMCRH